MSNLKVYIECNGIQEYVGRIFREDSEQAAVFQYSENALEKHLQISISLPLKAEPFSPEQTRCYFEGLLPEGFTRKSVAQWLHVDPNAYLSILSGLGKECLGAIQIIDDEDPTPMMEDYRKLSLKQVKALAAEGATESASIMVASHLSLTGASGKVGLYYNAKEQVWYQPIGLAPSTHIVKQSHVRLKNIVINELLALLTARDLGIETSDSFMINTGKGKDQDILLATRRYDRDMSHSIKSIRGNPCPLRIHQEDFAQALGIPSSKKYEPKNGSYLKRIFELVRRYSSKPMEDVVKLLDMLIFDVCIGNTDNHIKNLSFLYGKDLKEIRLAPAYDLICTRIYPSSTKEMSIAIAGKRDVREIDEQAFLDAAPDIGIQPRIIKKEYRKIHNQFRSAIEKATEELGDKGIQHVEEMKEKILNSIG